MSTKKRLLPFAVLGASLAVAVVLAFGAQRSAPTVLAHNPGTASHIEIDADPSGTPCSPVDATASVSVGSTFTVAICLGDSAVAPAAGNANTASLLVGYPAGLVAPNVATDLGTDLTSNPDWDQTATDTGADGTWDCNLTNTAGAAPFGNTAGVGPASIVCSTSDAADNLVAAPEARLATVTMTASTVGVGYALTPSGSIQTGAVESVCGIDIVCTGATIDVTPAGDLEITKSCTPNPVLAGGQVDCAFVITNNGPSAVPNVVLLDNLPDDKIYNDALSSVQCDLVDLPLLGLPGALNVIACGTATGAGVAISLASGESIAVNVIYDVPLSAAGKPETDYALVFGTSVFGIPVSLFPDPNLDPVRAYLTSPIGPCFGAPDPDLCAGLVLINAFGTSPTAWALCSPFSPIGAVTCNNVKIFTVNVTPADVTIAKVANQAVANTGDPISWTLTATNAAGASTASAVSITDTADSNQLITSATVDAPATGSCVETTAPSGVPLGGNTFTCTLTSNIASPGSAQVTVNATVVDIIGTVCTNNASVTFADPITRFAAPATMTCGLPTVTALKTGAAALGATVDWNVNVAVAAAPPAPAGGVVVTDTAAANQSILSAAIQAPATGSCVVSGTPGVTAGNGVTCTFTSNIAPGTSADVEIITKVLAYNNNVCTDQAYVDFTGNGAPFNTNLASIPCFDRVSMNKVPVASSSVGTPDNPGVNLWLCENSTACWPTGPSGNGHLVVFETLSNNWDAEGAGAFEFQLKYDHKIFVISISHGTDLNGDGDCVDAGEQCWLYSTGRIPSAPGGVGGCEMTIVTENYTLFGCVSKDDPAIPGIQTGPANGVVATVHIDPAGDLRFRMTPGQKNGVLRTILDENCEVADIFGDPIGTGLYDALNREILLPGIVIGGMIEDCGDLTITTRILEGDLDLNCIVDLVDDQEIAFRYGSMFGNLLYDPWYDLEPSLKDFDVDIKDLQKVFGRNGSTCGAPIPAQLPQLPGGGSGSPDPGPLP